MKYLQRIAGIWNYLVTKYTFINNKLHLIGHGMENSQGRVR